VVLAARGADRKTAADGIRAVIDESSCPFPVLAHWNAVHRRLKRDAPPPLARQNGTQRDQVFIFGVDLSVAVFAPHDITTDR
jgi:hypothetical protein